MSIPNYKLFNVVLCFVRFQLMSECWNEKPSERPTFDQVTKLLEKMLMKETPYFEPELLDESKTYYEMLEEDAVVKFT